VALMLIISLVDPKRTNEDKMQVEWSMFKTHPAFTIGAVIITGILAALYLIFEQQG
jgi:SSS family solute:Na+ symporter